MRTLGHIDHDQYMITVLSHNGKTTIQIDSGLFSQSYAFRDGSVVTDLNSATQFCDTTFLQEVQHRFQDMRQSYHTQISKNVSDEFPEII